MWSTCGEDNRADEAAANGGRDEGFFILDDFIEDPGLSTGNAAISTCQEGLQTLARVDRDGSDRTGDPAFGVAAELLLAELNLSVGVESCPQITEATTAAQILLASIGFDRSGSQIDYTPEIEDSAARITDLLVAYNTGNLCR